MKHIRAEDNPEAGRAADPLDQLAGEAQALQDGIDQAANDNHGPADATRPAELTNAQCLAMALQMIRETLCAIAKVTSPKHTLDDSTIQTVSDAVAPVLDKHGINLAAVAGDYMIELRAVVVTVPIILAARAALVEEIRAKHAKPVEPETAAAPPPEQ